VHEIAKWDRESRRETSRVTFSEASRNRYVKLRVENVPDLATAKVERRKRASDMCVAFMVSPLATAREQREGDSAPESPTAHRVPHRDAWRKILPRAESHPYEIE
jgi:hypothetical protein